MQRGSVSAGKVSIADELERARDREAATREILDVISRSRDDDRPVFDAVLRSAIKLCGANSAALLLGRADGAHLTLAALQESNGLSNSDLDRFIADINRVPMQMDPALHISAQAICAGAGRPYRRSGADCGLSFGRAVLPVHGRRSGRAHDAERAAVQRGKNYRRDQHTPARGASLQRRRDFADPGIRRAGRHRHRERAPVQGAGGAERRTRATGCRRRWARSSGWGG